MSSRTIIFLIIFGPIILYAILPAIVRLITKKQGSVDESRFADSLDKSDQGAETLSYRHYDRSRHGGAN